MDKEKWRDRVASSSLQAGLTMMAGASDRCFRKPEGSNEMKMTTVLKTVERYRHLWVTGMQTIASKRKHVHYCKYVCICI